MATGESRQRTADAGAASRGRGKIGCRRLQPPPVVVNPRNAAASSAIQNWTGPPGTRNVDRSQSGGGIEMAGRPWVLAESTLPEVRARTWEVAVLPWGATEAHNLHLPYGTDNIETERIAIESGRLAWERGEAVTVLPGVPFGVNAQQLDIPLTLNLNPSTQAKVLRDLVLSIEPYVHKLLILNGHGGNDFRAMIRELQPITRVFLCTANWYLAVDASKHFDEPGDHAGELETSLVMHLAPELVRPLSEAGSGRARQFRIAALRERWAFAPRRWTRVTEDTGVGDPRAATPAKGGRYFTEVTSKLADFLVELARAEVDDLYE
jgi:creatinine amidohydrolase